jgi:hypothetical protein
MTGDDIDAGAPSRPVATPAQVVAQAVGAGGGGCGCVAAFTLASVVEAGLSG